jgi:type I site-specific restriction-modification system R (restriction) subunit
LSSKTNKASPGIKFFTIHSPVENSNRRPDVVLFVNGLFVISDGFTARAGSLSAGYTRFSAWSCDNQNKKRPARRLAGD